MAALRLRRAIWISYFHSVLEGFRRHLFARCGWSVRVTAGCGGDITQIWYFIPVVKEFTIKSCLCCVSWSRCCIGRAYTHIQLRRGTAAVVKRSAGLDCVDVNPLGSVVMPGSASFNPPKTARRREHMRGILVWLRQCCKSLHVPAVGPKRNHRRWESWSHRCECSGCM